MDKKEKIKIINLTDMLNIKVKENIFNKFDSLLDFVTAEEKELLKIKGIGKKTINKIRGFYELKLETKKENILQEKYKFTSPDKIFSYFNEKYFNQGTEQFSIIYLSSDNSVSEINH